MKVKSIAECSWEHSAILLTFIKLPFVMLRFFCLFLCGHFTQVFTVVVIMFFRTTFFMKENKYYTPVNFFLPFAYIMILGFFFTESTDKVSTRTPGLCQWIFPYILIS